MVTSLHDGMNLVAKEFVASREDERGVLILSTFAGAAHELSDALLVNPYDISQLADSIHRARKWPKKSRPHVCSACATTCASTTCTAGRHIFFPI